MKNNNENKTVKRVFGVRTSVLAVTLALILAVAVGTTAALLIWKSDENVSSFVPAYTDCTVLEEDGAYSVINNGDTEVYVRAVFTVTWKNADGEIYGKVQPDKDVDYELTLNDKDWFVGKDGFYYCTKPLAVGEETPVLIESINALPAEQHEASEGNEDTTAIKFTDDYRLSVDMIAAAIQSEPAEAVEGYWNVKVGADGNIGK